MSVKLITRVWEQSQQKGSALLLTLAIADNANEKGVGFPGLEYLKDKTRLSKRQTERLVEQLSDTGEIYYEPGVGRGNKTVYAVLTGLNEVQIARLLEENFNLSPEQASTIAQDKIEKRRHFVAAKDDKMSPKRKGDILSEKVTSRARKGDISKAKKSADSADGDNEDKPDEKSITVLTVITNNNKAAELPDGHQFMFASHRGITAHFVKTGERRTVCDSVITHLLVEPKPGIQYRLCSKCQKTFEPPAPPLPHILIIDKYHAAIPDAYRPLGKPDYGKHSPAAVELQKAGFAPERVAEFVVDQYPGYVAWAESMRAKGNKVSNLMSLNHVAKNIREWDSRHPQTPQAAAEPTTKLVSWPGVPGGFFEVSVGGK